VLTPRADVVYLDVQADAGANRAKLRDDPHEILPLCDGGLEHVLGFVRARRVLEGVLAGRPLDLEALVEPALFVPEAMTIMRLLEEFKRRNLSAALVVDEFGDVEGIVSLTDVVTAIVGDLPADAGQEPAIVGRDDGSWLLDGALDVAILAQTLEDDSLALDGGPGQRYHTLGGLAMASLGRMPRTGDSFTRGRYRFEIVDMDGNRVDRVLATLRPPGP
jgi:putative hemolysin